MRSRPDVSGCIALLLAEYPSASDGCSMIVIILSWILCLKQIDSDTDYQGHLMLSCEKITNKCVNNYLHYL